MHGLTELPKSCIHSLAKDYQERHRIVSKTHRTKDFCGQTIYSLQPQQKRDLIIKSFYDYLYPPAYLSSSINSLRYNAHHLNYFAMSTIFLQRPCETVLVGFTISRFPSKSDTYLVLVIYVRMYKKY